MKLVALRAQGYRNLSTTIGFGSPVAVLVGENNTGKSNVVDALRTVLEPEAGPRHRNWLETSDFTHDGLGACISDEVLLEIKLSDLSVEEQARMVTCLSPKSGAGVAKIRLVARISVDGRVQTQWYGGDSQVAAIEQHARSAVRFVYLPPLRDAVQDLRPGRDNKLVGLIDALAPIGHEDREKLMLAAKQANSAFDDIGAIKNARKYVSTRLDSISGGGKFAQKTDLSFDDPRFEKVIGALRAQIGQAAPLDMDQNGLGYNNLLYMAVLLAAIADAPQDKEPILRVLLVEEPEAHLHPQLQDLLMRFLETEAGKNTQVILTTHSPNFAASAEIEQLTVMVKGEAMSSPVARLPRDFGLEKKQLKYLRRFLDATKASLFFARSVILVEGIAEQLLVPIMAERLGRPFGPNGVTVINVGGVAFPPFTDLFGPDKLPYRLAVVSDADAQPDEEDLDGEPSSLSPRAAALKDRSGEGILVCLSTKTLEYDLAIAGNHEVMLRALEQLKPIAGPRLRNSLKDATQTARADGILNGVSKVKGRFSQELAEIWSDPSVSMVIPPYLIRAIEWVSDKVDAPIGGTDADPATATDH